MHSLFATGFVNIMMFLSQGYRLNWSSGISPVRRTTSGFVPTARGLLTSSMIAENIDRASLAPFTRRRPVARRSSQNQIHAVVKTG
jgi:hypothetical protein